MTQELYNERVNRIKTAVALQKPDRVPVVILNDMFAANHMGYKMSDVCADIALSNKVIIDSAVDLGVDGIHLPYTDPNIVGASWLSKVKIPGIDLSDNEIWQIAEAELMKVEDYDVIINKGWNYFCNEFMLNRLDNIMAKMQPSLEYLPQAYKNCVDAGIVPLAGGDATSPFEVISGARSMTKFMTDLFKMPDKVEAAFEVAMLDIIANSQAVYADMGPIGSWVGGWRSASDLLSPKLWRRFVWPYLKKLAEITIEAGVIPIFHLDSNWERDLSYFLEMPKGKCIFYPDGSTNIFKIKEVLGDHMCINGDVPAALLTLGTEDEVYNYSVKLIKEIGPTGFILGQGCDIPPNAKLENVKAMVAAATGR